MVFKVAHFIFAQQNIHSDCMLSQNHNSTKYWIKKSSVKTENKDRGFRKQRRYLISFNSEGEGLKNEQTERMQNTDI